MSHDGRQQSLEEVPSMISTTDDEETTRQTNTNGLSKGRQHQQHQYKGQLEVDAFENPTELFQWINYGNSQNAAIHALENPVEARTWIVSKSDGPKQGKKAAVKWRYLPLHLVCMKQNPSQDLLRALIFTYPTAARERDHDGNLPIHYLIQEGNDQVDILRLLLQANPESIHQKDKKNRTLQEIVSEGYRNGTILKDTMVNILSILRQWLIEDARYSPNAQDHRRNGDSAPEQRDDVPPSLSFDTQDFDNAIKYENKVKSSKSHRRKRNKSREKKRRSSPETQNHHRPSPKRGKQRDQSPSNHQEVEKQLEKEKHKREKESTALKRVNSNLESKLEDTLAERDVLRDNLSKLKTEQMNQEMTLAALNKQINSASAEISRGKEMLTKKKQVIGKLESELKDSEGENQKLEGQLIEAERALRKRDGTISELREIINRLSEKTLRYENLVQQSKVSEAENRRLQDRMEKMAKSHREIQDSNRRKHTDLMNQIHVLERKLERASEADKVQQSEIGLLRGKLTDKQEDSGKVRALKVEVLANESRLRSRIQSLERELIESFEAKEVDENNKKTARHPVVRKLEAENVALRGTNGSLQEHVGALKERCRHLEGKDKELDAANKKIKQVENDLAEQKTENTVLQQEVQKVKSQSLILESNLQTQVAKLEKELLDAKQQAAEIPIIEEPQIDEEFLEQRLEEQRQSFQAVNDSLQDHVDALKDKCKTLQDSLDDSEVENNRLSSEIGDLKAELKERENQIQKVKTENEARAAMTMNQQQQEIQFEIKKLASAVQDISNYETESKLAAQLVGEMEQGYKDRLREHVEEIRELQHNKERLTSDNQDLRTELELSKQELNRALTQYAEDTKSRREAEERDEKERELLMEQIRESKVVLEDEIKTLNNEISNLRSSLQMEKDNRNTDEAIRRDLEARLEHQQMQNQTKNNDLDDKESRIEEMTKNLDKSQNDIETCKEELEKCHLDISRLQTTIEDQKLELANKQSRLDVTNEQVDFFKRQLEESKEGRGREVEELSNTIQTQKKSLAQLELKLQEVTRQADMHKEEVEELKGKMEKNKNGLADHYKTQLTELKDKFTVVKKNNSNLRGIIAKNNETYLAKVESISKELYELRQMKQSLHQHVHELSQENEKMKEVSMLSPQNAKMRDVQIKNLSQRVNQVAAFLMAVTSFQQEAVGLRRAGRDLSPERLSQRSKEAISDVRRREEDVLASSESRDDILHTAFQFEREIRAGRQNLQEDMRRQQTEMDAISRALDSIQRE